MKEVVLVLARSWSEAKAWITENDGKIESFLFDVRGGTLKDGRDFRIVANLSLGEIHRLRGLNIKEIIAPADLVLDAETQREIQALCR